MPDIETMEANDTAVLWPFLRSDRNGDPVLDDPVEISCRWENTRRIQTLPNGDRVQLLAEVSQLDRDIPLRSELWRGTLEEYYDSYGTGVHPDDRDVGTVVASREVPDINGINTWRSVSLTLAR